MSLEEEGAYIRALAFCWNHGSIPSDPEKLSRLIGKGASTTLATTLATMFEPDSNHPGQLVHARLNAERAKQDEWTRKSAEGGRKSAEMRQSIKGGSTTVETTVERVDEKWLQPNGNSSSSFPSSSSSLSPSLTSSPKHTHGSAFAKPSIDEAKVKALEMGLPEFQAEKFWNYYESNGWRVGRNPMKNWKAAMVNWKKTYESNQGFDGASRGSNRISAHEQRQIDCDPNRNGAKPHDFDAPLPFA